MIFKIFFMAILSLIHFCCINANWVTCPWTSSFFFKFFLCKRNNFDEVFDNIHEKNIKKSSKFLLFFASSKKISASREVAISASSSASKLPASSSTSCRVACTPETRLTQLQTGGQGLRFRSFRQDLRPQIQKAGRMWRNNQA